MDHLEIADPYEMEYRITIGSRNRVTKHALCVIGPAVGIPILTLRHTVEDIAIVDKSVGWRLLQVVCYSFRVPAPVHLVVYLLMKGSQEDDGESIVHHAWEDFGVGK